ncbi:MAG TPA: hypothetical protein VF765_18930, partial [Polyangiaceae bacterium]
MKLNIARVGALGPIGMALVATALNVGCAAGAGEPDQSSEPTGKSQEQWGIAPLGIGCGAGGGAVGTFAFSAPQVINTIVANTAALQNAQFQLYAVNNQGQQTLVNQQAQSATTAQQAMLAQATNFTSAQSALAQQSIQNAFQNSAASQQFANATNVTTAAGMNSAFQNSNSVVSQTNVANQQSWGSGTNNTFASNAAQANQAAQQNAFGANSAQNAAAQQTNAFGANTAQNAANTAAGTNAFNTSIVPTVGFFGGVGVLALPFSNATSANQFANTNALANNFFNNGANSAAQNVTNAFFNNGANTASQANSAN